jgi:hypothetical protein
MRRLLPKQFRKALNSLSCFTSLGSDSFPPFFTLMFGAGSASPLGVGKGGSAPPLPILRFCTPAYHALRFRTPKQLTSEARRFTGGGGLRVMSAYGTAAVGEKRKSIESLRSPEGHSRRFAVGQLLPIYPELQTCRSCANRRDWARERTSSIAAVGANAQARTQHFTRGVRSSWNSVRASRAASRGSGPGEDRDCTIELRITTTHGVRVSLDLDRGCDANAFQPLAVDMHVRDREQ